MRESHGRRHGAGAGGRFPIPMRGNETAAGLPAGLTYTAFPIPMRGNELTAVLAIIVTWTILWFPIPMRGNEADSALIAALDRGVFPIPMRGNEAVVTWQSPDGEQGFRSP